MSHARLLGLCTAVIASLRPTMAIGAPPGPRDELARLEDAVAEGERDGEDLASFRYARPWAIGASRAAAYVAVEGFGGTHSSGMRELGGIVVLQLPLAALGARMVPVTRISQTPLASASQVVELAAHDQGGVVAARVLPASLAQDARGRASAPSVAQDVRGRAVVEGTASLRPLVTFELARSCVQAAWRAVGLGDDARVEGLAARARWSASLPELRLRVMRTIDESGRLSLAAEELPRYTEAGGASNWFEARVSFRLDRLLFADEEIAIERLRADRAELRARTAGKTLQALFDWHRAFVLSTDASLGVEERLAAVGREIEASAVLDVMTDGWFGRYRAALSEPRP